jgi:hypothetical protein
MLAAALAFAACGDTLTVVMNAQNNSGEDGFATLTSKDSKTTHVYVQLRRPGTEERQESHVHPGTCGEIGDIAYRLNPLLPPVDAGIAGYDIPADIKGGDDGGLLVSATDIATGIDELTTGNWVINAHDEGDFALYVSCGQIQK